MHLQQVTRATTFLWSQPGRRGHPQAPGGRCIWYTCSTTRHQWQLRPMTLSLFTPSPPNLGLHSPCPLPKALPAYMLPPYIQQPGAPDVRGGVAGGLWSQTLDEGGRGALAASHSCTALGQQPGVARGERPRLRGIAGAPALAEAAVAAWQAVGSPAVQGLGGQAVGGGAPQAAGAPRQQPCLQRPQLGQHGQPRLLSAALVLAPRSSCCCTTVLWRLRCGAVSAVSPVPLLSRGKEASQEDSGTQQLGINGLCLASALLLHGKPGAEAGRRGAGAATRAGAPDQPQAGEGCRCGA